jgi:hypothetical protein
MKKARQVIYTFARAQIQRGFQKDLREYSKSRRTFEEFLDNLKAQNLSDNLSDSEMFAGGNSTNNKSKPILKLYAEPKNYSPIMSSTPGIKISTKLEGTAERVRYTATEGFFETLDSNSGIIGGGHKNYIEVPISQEVYWSCVPTSSTGKPSSPSSLKKEVSIKAEALIGLLKVAEQELKISSSDSLYYTVEDTLNVITEEAGDIQQMSNISFNGGEFSYPSSWIKGKNYIQDKTTGKTLTYSSKNCSEKELNNWIKGEIKRKLLGAEGSNTLRQPLSKKQKEPGLTEYGYAIGSKIDSGKEVLLKTTIFYNGKTRYEFQSALPPVAKAEYENVIGSFRLVRQ